MTLDCLSSARKAYCRKIVFVPCWLAVPFLPEVYGSEIGTGLNNFDRIRTRPLEISRALRLSSVIPFHSLRESSLHPYWIIRPLSIRRDSTRKRLRRGRRTPKKSIGWLWIQTIARKKIQLVTSLYFRANDSRATAKRTETYVAPSLRAAPEWPPPQMSLHYLNHTATMNILYRKSATQQRQTRAGVRAESQTRGGGRLTVTFAALNFAHLFSFNSQNDI